MTNTNKHNDEELKRCPHCGGKAELHIEDMSIYCGDCDAGVTNYESTKDDLIKAWNTRTDTQELTSKVPYREAYQRGAASREGKAIRALKEEA